jgi:hypothetical protein
LNRALRRNSGSNVHRIDTAPARSAQARWASFSARPTPRLAASGLTPAISE